MKLILKTLCNSAGSPSSGNSNLSSNSLEKNRNRFKRVFGSNKEHYGLCVWNCETWNSWTYWGKDWKGTVKSFYYGVGDPKFSTIMLINRWVDCKNNEIVVRNSGKELSFYGLGLEWFLPWNIRYSDNFMLLQCAYNICDFTYII